MRRYGLDWLRIIVVFLLFPFHTARVFDQWEPNYIKDVTNGFSSIFVSAVGYWFMALLFVIAGYSTYSALQKRTIKEYSNERVKRLLIPFLFGLVLIIPIQGYVAVLQKGLFSGSYIEYLGKFFFTDFSDLSGYFGSFTPAHLWFILFLYAISMCLLPLLKRLKNKEPKIADGWLLIPAFVVMSVFEAVPAIGGKNIVFDAVLFLYGFLIARSKTAMDTIRRYRFAALAGALVISPVYLILSMNLGWPSGYSLMAAGFALLRNLSVWLIILAALGLADAYLNKPGKTLAYMNRASFPIYILHQSVMMVVAYFVVSADLSPAVKFLAIMFGTLAACAGLYEVFRRIPPIRFMLGIKNSDNKEKNV